MDLEKAIEEGLTSFHIAHNEEMLNGLCFYIRELKKWNDRMNLVGLKEMESVVRELLYDAFFIYGYVGESKTVLDMGSGAGIIAIPLKILRREMDVFSVDRGLKKIQFQRHIKRVMHLKGFMLIHSRIEILEGMGIDSLVVKGFGGIQEILEKGGKHVKKGGHAFIVKGKREKPVDCEGFVLQDEVPYALPLSEKGYRLFIYMKT